MRAYGWRFEVNLFGVEGGVFISVFHMLRLFLVNTINIHGLMHSNWSQKAIHLGNLTRAWKY